MSDPSDEFVPLDGRAAQANTAPREGALPQHAEAHRALLELLRRDPDHIVESLCDGRPRDIVGECREHVADNAYFIEEDRVAAKVIARLASLAGAPTATALESLDGLVEIATSEVLDEGPLAQEPAAHTDDPLDDDPPLIVRLSRSLGVSVELALRLLPRLNALDFEDRHVVYHCVVERMTPREYAERYDDDPKIVSAMLGQLVKLALDGGR